MFRMLVAIACCLPGLLAARAAVAGAASIPIPPSARPAVPLTSLPGYESCVARITGFEPIITARKVPGGVRLAWIAAHEMLLLRSESPDMSEAVALASLHGVAIDTSTSERAYYRLMSLECPSD